MTNLKSRNNKSLSGFTLLELVIAISVFAIILSISYRVFSQLASSKIILDEERDIAKIAHSFMTRFTREIQHVQENQLMLPPNKKNNPYNTDNFLISKNKNMSNRKPGIELTFVAKDVSQFIRGQQLSSGIVQITYRIEEDPEAKKSEEKGVLLIRDELNYQSDHQQAYDNILTFPITNNIGGMQLLFYNKEQQQWSDEWTTLNRGLPSLLKLNLELIGKSGKNYNYSTVFPIKRG